LPSEHGGTSRCCDTSLRASSKYRMSSGMRVFFIQYACGSSRSWTNSIPCRGARESRNISPRARSASSSASSTP
jgi:hypothetical protein